MGTRNIMARTSRRWAGALALAFAAATGIFVPVAGAQDVDPADCTVFFPENCVDPATGGINFGLFGDDFAGYSAALGALARQQAGDDSDNNGVPDSPEIAVCGAPGCINDWIDTSTPTEEKVITTPFATCNGMPVEYTLRIPPGFHALKGFAVIEASDLVVHYSGPYPKTGEVTLRYNPPAVSVGVHRVVAIGTDAESATPKVVIWRHDVTPTPHCPKVGGMSQARTVTRGGSSLVRTGTNAASLAAIGGGLVLLGGAVVLGLSRRRRSN